MQENVPAQLDTLGGKPEPKAADEHGVLNSQMSRISFTMNALTGKNCDLRSQKWENSKQWDSPDISHDSASGSIHLAVVHTCSKG